MRMQTITGWEEKRTHTYTVCIITVCKCTGPLKKLFHYAIFLKFFHFFIH